MQWRARWIWSPGEPAPRNFYWCVRKEFQLPKGFHQVEIAISADTRYTLWFNGRLIGQGPVRAFHGHWYYDVHDVTEYAQAGLNAIAVLVHHYGIGTFQYDFVRGKGRGGLIAQVDCDGKTVAASDASWLNVPHPAFDRQSARMSCQLAFDEYYDARRGIGDWTMPRYDDYEWNEAVEIGEAGCEPWGELLPRPIPFLTQEQVYPQHIHQVRVVRPPKRAWAFDLKPYLAPGDLTANPRTLVGMIATVVRTPDPVQVQLGAVHHPLRSDTVRLNGQPVPFEAGFATLDLTPGEHLLTVNVSRWYHDWYFYPFADWEADVPVEFLNPLMPRGEPPWVVIGPFESEQSERFQALWSATNAEALHHQREVCAVDSLYTAKACVFAETVHAKPLPETARIENTPACINAVDDVAILHPPTQGDLELWVDFGCEVVGYVEFEMEAPAGTIVDFNGFEYLDPVNPDRVQWTTGLNNTFRYVARAGWQRFRSIVRRGFRYATLTFRFPQDTTQPVYLRSLSCILNTYPYEQRGLFRCSDPLLNQIYDMSCYTVRLCSEDTFVDCPAYEQTFWVGDARNEALFAYAGFGDYTLARRCLMLAGQSLEKSPLVESQVPSAWENILTAWALLWAIACYEHYLFTGDLEFARALFPTVQKQNENLHTRYINTNGLLEISAWNMLDWAPMDTPSQGVVTHQNMWLVKVWEDTAQLAEALGETLHAQTWRQWAHELREAINRHLWVEERRAYTDCLREDGTPSPVFSQQTQVVASLCDIPNTPERKAIVESYLHEAPGFVPIGSPFMMAFLLEALQKAGHRAPVLEHIREAWGMMVAMGATTCWEVLPNKLLHNPLHASETAWGGGGWFTRSHCHAWSAAPAYALPACILGIQILEPGFQRFALAPNLCGLEWAYGAFPTPKGAITYALERAEGKTRLLLTVPPNTTALIGGREYPAGRHEVVV